MSDSINLVLDTPVIRLGEELRGTVQVNVDRNCTCKALTLEARWQVLGRSQCAGKGPSIKLFDGTWRAGEQARYPFVLPAPQGPVSQDGIHLKLGWELRARADIARAPDLEVGEMFVLKPAPIASYHAGPTFRPPKPPGAGMGGLFLIWVIFLVLGGIVGLLMQGSGMRQGLLWGLAGGTVLAGLVGRDYLTSWLASRRLGSPRIRIDPVVAAPGQALTISLQLKPSRPLKLNKKLIRVTAEESWVHNKAGSHTGNDSTIQHHTLASFEPVVQVDEAALAQGRPCTLSAVVDIPSDAPCSFGGNGISLKWHCLVHVVIEGWPDLEESVHLAVLPGPV
ncbi:MAG: hypothetical protein ABIJ09_09640 [Pseudomonadota bacterium]